MAESGPPAPGGGARAEGRAAGADARPDVAELAVLVDAARRVLPGCIGEQQRVLARVVCRRRRGIAAVIRREDQQIAVVERVEDVGQPAVEVLQAAMEVDGIVSVPPELVGLDEVHEDEPRVHVLE